MGVVFVCLCVCFFFVCARMYLDAYVNVFVDRVFGRLVVCVFVYWHVRLCVFCVLCVYVFVWLCVCLCMCVFEFAIVYCVLFVLIVLLAG